MHTDRFFFFFYGGAEGGKENQVFLLYLFYACKQNGRKQRRVP